MKEDIPLNMATHQLISFIEEVKYIGIKLPYRKSISGFSAYAVYHMLLRHLI